MHYHVVSRFDGTMVPYAERTTAEQATYACNNLLGQQAYYLEVCSDIVCEAAGVVHDLAREALIQEILSGEPHPSFFDPYP